MNEKEKEEMNCNPFSKNARFDHEGKMLIGLWIIVILGNSLSCAISFVLNKSIIWAIIHGFMGWIYVLYAGLFRNY